MIDGGVGQQRWVSRHVVKVKIDSEEASATFLAISVSH
jgi:hypothetical protein